LKDIHASYRAILKRLAACLGVEGLSHRGFSDLALGERKVSGNAQRRKSRTLLHHGTLLYDFDLEAMAAVLKDPSRQPDYRNRRVHADFTTNLAVDAEEIRLRISRGWNVSEGHQPLEMPDIQPLLREKYANPSWTDRF
jgi:lipoate-protein ligase A